MTEYDCRTAHGYGCRDRVRGVEPERRVREPAHQPAQGGRLPQDVAARTPHPEHRHLAERQRAPLAWGDNSLSMLQPAGLTVQPKIMALVLVRARFLWRRPYLERVQGSSSTGCQGVRWDVSPTVGTPRL